MERLTCSSSSPGRHVDFLPEPSVKFIENPGSERSVVKMAKQLYETFAADEVTDTMLVEAARLFSENYGTWGKLSGKTGPVKLSARRLREQYLPKSAESVYVSVTVDGNLAGNAFACRWKCNGKNVCWVTQLVVDKDYRQCGLASGLLRQVKVDTDDVYGVMSSHPAACLAAAKVFGMTIEKISLSFISENVKVMEASPVPYIRGAELTGTLFKPEDSSGLVSGVNTRFFVDHAEPLEALSMVEQEWKWPLGKLPDGQEFLLIMPGRHRRSRSRSGPASDVDR